MWSTATTVSRWDYVAPSTDGSLVWRLKCHSLSSLGPLCLAAVSGLRLSWSCVHFVYPCISQTSRGIQSKTVFPSQPCALLRSLNFFFSFFWFQCQGVKKGSEENLQWLGSFDTAIALYVPYSAQRLGTISAHFSYLWGQPQPVPSPACSSSNISSWWMTIQERSNQTEVELLLQSFSVVLSSNALPLLPCEGMCFEAYEGPQHWLNHLFRTHHLQGPVAMLTSFSDAPRGSWQCCVYPRCQTHRGRAEQSSHHQLLGHPLSTQPALPLCLLCSTSGMKLLPNARQ